MQMCWPPTVQSIGTGFTILSPCAPRFTRLQVKCKFSRIRYTLFTEQMNRVEGGFRPASLRRNRLNLDVTELN